jgi:hypothetical protein
MVRSTVLPIVRGGEMPLLIVKDILYFFAGKSTVRSTVDRIQCPSG